MNRAGISRPDDAEFYLLSKDGVFEEFGQLRCDEVTRLDVCGAAQVAENLQGAVELRRTPELFELDARQLKLMEAEERGNGDHNRG